MATTIDEEPETSVARPDRRFTVGLGVITLVALGIRVAFIATKQAHSRLAGDAGYYFLQARAVADGHGFVQPFIFYDSGQVVPAADHPPGFIGLLVMFNKLGLRTPLQQRYALCVLGTVTVVLVALLARKLVSDRFGLIVGALCAVYPQIWINDGMLMSETLYVFSLVVALWFTYEIWRSLTWRSVIGATLALALASYTRPESVLLFVLMLVPVVLARTGTKLQTRVAMLGASALLTAVIFTPWVVYNLGRFDKPVYLSTGFGQTLLAANCDETYSGQFLGWYSGTCLADDIVNHPPTGDPSRNDIFFRDKALRYMRDHAGELPKVVLAREGRMWAVWRTDQMVALDGWIEGRGSVTISRWAQRSYWLIGALAIVGAFRWRRHGVPFYPLGIQIGLTVFVAAMTFGVTRYRAGAEITLVLLAATAIDWAIGTRRATSDTLGAHGRGTTIE